MPLLEVENLQVEYRSANSSLPVVRGLSFTMDYHETVGLVGESGCGKSTVALAIMGLLPSTGRIVSGSVRIEGVELVNKPERELCRLRGKQMAMVFQDPFASLDPTMTIGAQLQEAIRAHLPVNRSQAYLLALNLLKATHLPSPQTRMRQYPHELSGGQRQRVMIAIAFACNPLLLLADEPTTALDVTVQAQILQRMAELQRQTGTGLLLITHDLGVVAETCDRVLVMYAGQLVETGTTTQVFSSPLHPYTKGLLASTLSLEEREGYRKPLPTLPGAPPNPAELPAGCPFFPRCESRIPGVCDRQTIPLFSLAPGQQVRCLLYEGKSHGNPSSTSHV